MAEARNCEVGATLAPLMINAMYIP